MRRQLVGNSHLGTDCPVVFEARGRVIGWGDGEDGGNVVEVDFLFFVSPIGRCLLKCINKRSPPQDMDHAVGYIFHLYFPLR